MKATAKPTQAASGQDLGYDGMPSTKEIFQWIETMWQFGDRDKYRWRMPGTSSDHRASEFLEQKFKEIGLQDVWREPVSIPVHFPDRWSLTVRAPGKREDIPCWFVRYAAATPPEGLTAELVYAGRGSKQEFEAVASRIAGKIAVVDLFSTGTPINYGDAPIWVYDPKGTLLGDMFSETYPINNQQEVIDLARRFGAIGLIGILVSRPSDVCVEYHGAKSRNMVISALTVSSSAGERIKELLSNGVVQATLVLEEDAGPPPPAGPSRFGKWGVTHNVYGVIPGSSDEWLVLLSHHDGGAVNESTGPAVLMATAEYLVKSGGKRRKNVLFFVIGSHFGLRPPLLDQARGIASINKKIACAMNVEMIGRQYKVQDGRHVATGLSSPAMWGIRNGNPQLVEIVREAIEKHNLDRSFISDHLLGEGAVMAGEGGVANIIERIALNAPQFSLEDRPEAVDKEALRPTACAFVDIVNRLDVCNTIRHFSGDTHPARQSSTESCGKS